MIHTKNFCKDAPGCFAPPITSENIARYRELAAGASEPIGDAMGDLIEMVVLFRETPASSETPEVVPVMAVVDGELKTSAKCTPLEDAEVDRIWDAVPWVHVIGAMSNLFQTIPKDSQKELRDAAFHLIWYARELVQDREPMTKEALW